MSKSSIIFADDNLRLREYLRMAFQADSNFLIAKEAGDGLELLEQLKEITPDIVLLDISMPNLSGLQAAEIIKQLYPQVKIVILTFNQSHTYFRRASEIGVDGYVLKEEIEDINNIIMSVLQGKTYISSYFKTERLWPDGPKYGRA